MSRAHTLFNIPPNAETKTTPSTSNMPSPAKTSRSRAPFDLRALQQDPNIIARRKQKRSEDLNAGASVSQRDTTQHRARVIADDVTADDGNIDARAIGHNPSRYLSNSTAKKGNLLAAVVDPTTLHGQSGSATEAKRSTAHTAVGEMINVRADMINASVIGANPCSTAQRVHGRRGVTMPAIDPTTASSSDDLQETLDKTGGSVGPISSRLSAMPEHHGLARYPASVAMPSGFSLPGTPASMGASVRSTIAHTSVTGDFHNNTIGHQTNVYQHYSSPVSSEAFSTPSTVPFSSIQNDKLIALLKTHYAKQDKLPSLISEYQQPITGINLTIADYQSSTQSFIETKEGKGEAKTSREKGLDYFESLHRVKHPIDPVDIFDKAPGLSGKLEIEPAKHLLIVGAPGVGKTTMSQWFAYQWATDSLWADKFEYVFWIPLRHLPILIGEKTTGLELADIIYRHCFKGNRTISVTQISAILREKRNKILIIADGYDEIASLLKENIDTDPSPLARILHEILQTEYVIITSRPYQLNYLPSATFCRLENIGFTDENIENYITQYFARLIPPQPTWGEDVLDFLTSRPNIYGTAHSPINLALICEEFYLRKIEKNNLILYREGKDEANVQDLASPIQNMTTLYYQLTLFLLKRYLKDKRNIKCDTRGEEWIIEKCNLEIHFLSRLAFAGLQAGQVTLSPTLQQTVLNQIEKNDPKASEAISPFEAILASGFLRSGAEPFASELRKPHYFIHLTFQEFLAAYYLISCLKKSAESEDYLLATQFIKTQRYSSRYMIVFEFMAGLLSADKHTQPRPSAEMRLFWKLALDEPRDLTGVGHLNLILRCLEEANGDPRIPHYDEMVSELKEWANTITLKGSLSHDFYPFNRVPGALKQIGIINELITELQNRGNLYFAISLISHFDITTPAATSILLKALTGNDAFSGIEAARVAANLRIDTVEITQAALNIFIKDKEEIWYKQHMAKNLIKIAIITSDNISSFRMAMQDEELIFDEKIEQLLLNKLGIESSKDPSMLIKMLREGDIWIKRQATIQLGQLLPPSLEVVSALLATAWNDKHPQVKFNALFALDKQLFAAKKVAQFMSCTSSGEDNNSLAAPTPHLISVWIKQNPELVPILINLCFFDLYLLEISEKINEVARKILKRFLVETPDIVAPHLIHYLSSHSRSKVEIIALLSQIPQPSIEVVSFFINELSQFPSYLDTSILLHEQAAIQILSKLSELAVQGKTETVEHILAALSIDNSEIKIAAIQSLGKIAPQFPRIISAITNMLKDSNEDVKVEAIVTLSQFPESFSQLIPKIKEILEDEILDLAHYLELLKIPALLPLIKSPVLMLLTDTSKPHRWHDEYSPDKTTFISRRNPETTALFLTKLAKQPEMRPILIEAFEKEKMPAIKSDIAEAFNGFDLTPLLASLNISQLAEFLGANNCLNATPLISLMKAYFTTLNLEWVPIIVICAFARRIPLVETPEGIWIDEGQQEEKPLPFPTGKRELLMTELMNGFARETRWPHLNPARRTFATQAPSALDSRSIANHPSTLMAAPTNAPAKRAAKNAFTLGKK